MKCFSCALSIINRDNIHSIGELEGKIQRLKSEYENARRELNTLIVKQEKLEGLVEQAETYFSLAGKSQLSDTDQLSLKICRQTLQNNFKNRYTAEIVDKIFYITGFLMR